MRQALIEVTKEFWPMLEMPNYLPECLEFEIVAEDLDRNLYICLVDGWALPPEFEVLPEGQIKWVEIIANRLHSPGFDPCFWFQFLERPYYDGNLTFDVS